MLIAWKRATSEWPLRGCVWSVWIPADQKRGVWRRRVPCGCGGEGDISLVLLDLVVGDMLPRNVDHGAQAGGQNQPRVISSHLSSEPALQKINGQKSFSGPAFSFSQEPCHSPSLHQMPSDFPVFYRSKNTDVLPPSSTLLPVSDLPPFGFWVPKMVPGLLEKFLWWKWAESKFFLNIRQVQAVLITVM
ncbi:uncharacterized protein LOC121911615 isoform X3 [Thunnus maccoyii]|uniref:uncharacterized protein LOC121911615 isoform X3 n=1 Tax=Thunnus maccoyii TaxID=8240 RepID=UPI001C4D98C0|nr:uncharacterized protein LOC121911615 isoform X3 [Thunnus maccoyii]